MKWIGQHIVDFIARFRSDVYLEDIADGTVADNKFLGLDSNNKIVKEAASATVTDLHTAGVDGSATQLLTDVGDGTINSEAYLTFSNNVSSAKMEFLSPADTGDKFQINTTTHGATTLTTIDDDATAAHFEIAANGNITLDAAGSIALEAGSGVVTGDAAAYQFSSSSTSRPSFSLDNNTDDATGPTIQLRNFRDGNGLEDGDILGNIVFDGHDVVGQDEGYGSIVASAIETGNGDEAGQIAISVANDGTPRNGITMTADKGTAEEVDVTIANGAASTTTVAGGLVVTTGLPVVLSSEAQGQFGVQVARRTITTAEANAMNSVPIELVPAQGANTVIVLLGGMIRVDRAATQTEAACNLHIHYESEEPGTFGQSILYHHRRFMHNNTVDRVFHIHAGIAGGVPVTDSLTEDVDAAMEVSFDAAATLNCFTSIEVYITYQVISIA